MISRLLLLLVVCIVPLRAQRFLVPVFPAAERSSNIEYGRNTNVSGVEETLFMDIYQPRDDTAPARPLVIFVHGGGFVGGDKGTAQFVTLCTEFARRGYVTASINYRLDTTASTRGIMNAMHDARAAVRYFRRFAAQYRIDTTRIAMGGGSAGAYTSLCTAYVDEPGELYPGSGARDVEGNSGNAGHGSTIHACLDYWGALMDASAIQSAADPPLLIFHGTEDKTVPFSNATALDARARAIGLRHEFHPLQGEGHGPWKYMDSIVNTTARFLYSVLIEGSTGLDAAGSVPAGPGLHANYPNPFSGVTMITFSLPRSARITLRVCDMLGRELALLDSGERDAGNYTLAWTPGALPAGLYLARLDAGSATVMRSMLLQR